MAIVHGYCEEFTLSIPEMLLRALTESKKNPGIRIEFSGQVVNGKILFTEMSYDSNFGLIDVTEFGDDIRVKHNPTIQEEEIDNSPKNLWEQPDEWIY